MKFIFIILGVVQIGMRCIFSAEIPEVVSDKNLDNDDDSEIVEAARSLSEVNFTAPLNSIRVQRQLSYQPKSMSLLKSQNPTETNCLTTTGAPGRCMSFRDCYPVVRNRNFVVVRQLTLLKFEKWSINSNGDCSVYTAYGQLLTGVCCPNRNEENGIGTVEKENKQTSSWGFNPFGFGTHFSPFPTFGFFVSNLPVNTSEIKPDEPSEFTEKPDKNLIDLSLEGSEKEKNNSTIGIGGAMGNHPPQDQDKKPQNVEENEANFGEVPYDPIDNDEEKNETNSLTHQLGIFNWPPMLPTFPSSILGKWPPQIPTHPPDHHYPTHAQSVGRRTTTTTKKPYRPVFRPITTGSPTESATTESLTPVTTLRPLPAPPGQCGVRNGAPPDQERIVGGQNAIPNEYPWVVVLFKSGKQFCGGSLIDHEHVITAAHCVAKMTPWTVATLTANLGDHNIRSSTEVAHVERRIKRLVRHKGFEFSTLHNDIAILTLDEPVKYSRNIQPICLPDTPETETKSFNGQVATVAGWGSLRENGPQPYILQKVTVNIWPNSECARKYGRAAPAGIVQSMICAGQAARDSCSGDSGGPLMLSDDNGHWIQVGIVSWGIGCGSGRYPGVYTRITSFLPWIKKNLK